MACCKNKLSKKTFQQNLKSYWQTENKIRVKAKIRYRQSSALATLFLISKTKAKIIFDKPQKAVTPGQFVVFYKKNVCLGGGKIIK